MSALSLASRWAITPLLSKPLKVREAILGGASEVDMVINIGALKDKDYDYVQNEIAEAKKPPATAF